MTTQAYFNGAYVDAARDIAIASMLSRQNMLWLSSPGGGKSSIFNALLSQIYGTGNYAFIQIKPTSSDEIVVGRLDTELYLRTGKYQMEYAGTPYDPSVKAFVLDELSRGNDAVYDAAVHALERVADNNIPAFATTNFLPSDKRQEALLDRFGFYYLYDEQPDDIDVNGMVAATMQSFGGNRLMVPGTLPTPQEIEDVRNAMPGAKAIAANQAVIERLAAKCLELQFRYNRRQLTQWTKILFYNSVYATGSADYTNVPDTVMDLLAHTWPARSAEEGERWRALIGTMTDPLKVLIHQILAEAAQWFNNTVDTITERRERTLAMTTYVQESQEKLFKHGSDPRLEDAADTLQEWAAKAAKGEKIERA